MKNLLVLMFLIFAGWKFYNDHYISPHKIEQYKEAPKLHKAIQTPKNSTIRKIKSVQFKCDSRQYCSQMKSCAEAKYFIQNCPNTKMDGDNDGVPCEKQWC
jgi:hypothetical protein